MSIEVLLLETVVDLGKIGEVVKVSDGYARNYLLPKKLATPVTKAALRAIEAKKVRVAADEAARLDGCKVLAETIAKLTVTVKAKAADDDKLYGSVTVPQILAALAAEKIEVTKAAIHQAEPIKTLGEFTVEVRLHPEVTATLKVKVARA